MTAWQSIAAGIGCGLIVWSVIEAASLRWGAK